MIVEIPSLALVVLIGPSGSGKSTFAARHFLPSETVSSDGCREMVSDDPNNQAATKDAFELLHFIASKRLERGLLTVVDATNVQRESRAPLLALARKYHCLPVALVFNLPEKICRERNRARADRNFGPEVIRRHIAEMRRSSRGLAREGFRHVHTFITEEQVDSAAVTRQPMWNDRRNDTGPFDIIGDIHGCHEELRDLLGRLGYEPRESTLELGEETPVWRHPSGRKPIFLGDLVDRGPSTVEVVRTVKAMVEAGAAYCVPGNHDIKLMRKLRGKNVNITHGLEDSLQDIERIPEELRGEAEKDLAAFIDKLVSHYVFDAGRLVVAHAGMKESMQGRGSGGVREFALYGETTGETDEFGLPVRYNWAADYEGRSVVVYGHTPVPEPEWLNHTINIDTGCVFGGRLTALRWPERELVSVPARETYCEPVRPLAPPAGTAEPPSAQQAHDRLLDIDDVLGKRVIETRLASRVTVREENAQAALEVMSRFAVDPRWLIYLPPTMSPSETSDKPGLLEDPDGAFDYYRKQGVGRVICEEKHMGSRAVLAVCRDEERALARFGVTREGAGIAFSRTGRLLLSDSALEAELLVRVRNAVESSGLFDELDTDWVLLDCEFMPWSAKAQGLLREQYAAVGSAGRIGLHASVESLGSAAESLPDAAHLLAVLRGRQTDIERYIEAYRRYCWPVHSIADVWLAPFHVLATEGAVHVDKSHEWHMETCARICEAGGNPLLSTRHVAIDVEDELDRQKGIEWWEAAVAGGGEGMVVKPLDFVARGSKGLVQPAIKVRGPEYLRIIYGPEYLEPANLSRLRQRGLNRKRSLAMREFALGVEALERFVRHEPLRTVHECVFGVLAMESEPVDPRL